MNCPPRDEVSKGISHVLKEILAFRGLTEPSEAPISDATIPTSDLGLSSEDLVMVGPELAQLTAKLEVPCAVLDWADDSSGARRYRTVGEMADRIVTYLSSSAEAIGHE